MDAWKFRGGWGVLLGFLLGGGLLFRAEAIEAITAGPGYEVTVFATGLQHPTALVFGPPVPFGGMLYLVERGSGQETGRLVALDSLGQATSLAEGLRSPLGLVFSPGGVWGSFAYLLAGPGGLGLVRVSPLGTAEVSHALPGGVRAVGGIVLSPEGSWGQALYLSDAAEGTLVRVSPEGTMSVFLKGLSGPRSLALAPPGSPWGEGLYVTTGRAVLRVGVDGQASPVVEGLVAPGSLAFGEGEALGTDLYLAEGGLAGGRVLKVSPSGTVTLVAQGFGVVTGMALAPGGPFGPALFIADGTAGMIYRIAPVGR